MGWGSFKRRMKRKVEGKTWNKKAIGFIIAAILTAAGVGSVGVGPLTGVLTEATCNQVNCED